MTTPPLPGPPVPPPSEPPHQGPPDATPAPTPTSTPTSTPAPTAAPEPAPHPFPAAQRTRWPSTAASAVVSALLIVGVVAWGLAIVPAALDAETDLDLPDSLPALTFLGVLLLVQPVLATVLLRRVSTPLPSGARRYGFALGTLLLGILAALLTGLAAGVAGVLLILLLSGIDENVGWFGLLIPVVALLVAGLTFPFVLAFVCRRAERRLVARGDLPR